MHEDLISSRLFEEAFGMMPLEFFVFDSESLKFSHVNEVAQKNLQYPMTELASMTIDDIQPAFNKEDIDMRLHFDTDHGSMEITRFAAKHTRRDGSDYDVEMTLFRIKEDPREYLALATGATDRRKVVAVAAESWIV